MLFKNVSLHAGVKCTNYVSNKTPFYFSCVLLQSAVCSMQAYGEQLLANVIAVCSIQAYGEQLLAN